MPRRAWRRVIDELEPASFEVETDTGARICVAIDIDRARGKAIVDFTGTSAQAAGYLQCA